MTLSWPFYRVEGGWICQLSVSRRIRCRYMMVLTANSLELRPGKQPHTFYVQHAKVHSCHGQYSRCIYQRRTTATILLSYSCYYCKKKECPPRNAKIRTVATCEERRRCSATRTCLLNQQQRRGRWWRCTTRPCAQTRSSLARTYGRLAPCLARQEQHRPKAASTGEKARSIRRL